jgi:hypothetical protein
MKNQNPKPELHRLHSLFIFTKILKQYIFNGSADDSKDFCGIGIKLSV